ncbi:LANO_0D05864g1_1 [Lachancea nothofagi CBS 11611]|uniref:LANO_0D05864g1_1 n=1 Tax=Lachancea nothofagi CBS 11611 TaxID=1266666 RepID=A0A1G4JH10_9SACH|nr:LANO_0D05864g1_1 [Lachancea nothofagi CBS 11611]
MFLVRRTTGRSVRSRLAFCSQDLTRGITTADKTSINNESTPSAGTSPEEPLSEPHDELSVLRQREYNNQVKEILRSFSKTPTEEISNFHSSLSKDLGTREKQLDDELTSFLKQFSQLNKVIEPKSDRVETQVLSNQSRIKSFPFLVPSSKDKPYSTQELFLRQMKHAENSGKLGASIENVYLPHRDIFNPPTIDRLSISELLAAGVHLGQSTSLWRPNTQPYIYGEYKGIHIIDLNKTLSSVKRAAAVVQGVAERGGTILFLGTREGQKRALQEAARRTHGFYVSTRWIPGTLTNPTEISSVWERHEVDFADMPTNRQLNADEEAGIVKPDLLVILNPTENRNALNEAMQARIPTIGIIDTDSEPSLVTYPIPGNDDSLRSVNLLLSVLAKAGEIGLQSRLQKITSQSAT